MIFQPHIPSSSDSKIIIPFDKDDNKFSRTTYSPAMTGGRASTEEVNQILNLLDKASKIPFTLQQVLWRAFVRLAIPIVFIIYAVEDWRCYRIESFTFYAIIYMIVSLLLLRRDFHLKTKVAKTEAYKILQMYESSFEKRGLRWSIPKEFPMYMELNRDYREKYFESQIPYNPQNNTPIIPVSQFEKNHAIGDPNHKVEFQRLVEEEVTENSEQQQQQE